MEKLALFALLLSCVTVALARDETSACRDVTRQTCNGFQQCCARKCGGAHRTTCTEGSGRISQASCTCEGRGSTGDHSSHSHGTGGFGGGSSSGSGHLGGSDHSNICRLVAEGSCNAFRSCCESKCQRPARLSCSSRGSTLSESVCQCPTGGSSGGLSPTHRPSQSGGGLTDNIGEHDFTHTCTRNNHDCTSFRSCCQNRCPGLTIQSQCQESRGQLKNTLCKCGRPF